MLRRKEVLQKLADERQQFSNQGGAVTGKGEGNTHSERSLELRLQHGFLNREN